MLLIRRFEEKAGQLYGMGLIGGFCHLYIGQEAVVVGHAGLPGAGRPGHHLLPRPRPHAGHRHGGARRDGGADRALGRLLQGQGRLDAHVQPREGLLRRPRHRRRAGGARHRPRLRQLVPREPQRLPDLFRRGRLQPGPGLRELQPRRADEAAGASTSSRTTSTAWAPAWSAPRASARPVEERRALGHPGRAGGRHGRRGGEGGRRARRRPLPRRATARTCWR